MNLKLLGCIVVSALILSGCSSTRSGTSNSVTNALTSGAVTSGSTTRAPTQNPIPPCNCTPPQILAGNIQLIDCFVYYTNFGVLQSEVQKRLPPGYETSDSSAVILANVDVRSCSSAAIGNAAVEHEVKLFSLSVPVVPPQGTEGNGTDDYAFERGIEGPATLHVFQANGIHASGAKIQFGLASPDTTIEVQLPGATYTLSIGGTASTQGPPFLLQYRDHDFNGTNLWYDGTYTATDDNGGAVSGTIQSNGGLLSSLTPLPSSPMTAVLAHQDETLEFQGSVKQ